MERADEGVEWPCFEGLDRGSCCYASRYSRQVFPERGLSQIAPIIDVLYNHFRYHSVRGMTFKFTINCFLLFTSVILKSANH